MSFSGEIKKDEPLSRHTYYQIGGPARFLALPKSIDDLKWLSQEIQKTKSQFFILGLGSNLLVADRGFDGWVIKTSRLNLEISADGTTLRAGSGVPVSMLLRRCAQEGWDGMQFLTGVPGTVGGTVFMNAGTHLGESKDRLIAVEYFRVSTGEIVRVTGDGLRYQYRKNLFLPEDAIVYAAEWRIARTAPEQVKNSIDETLVRRKSTQPIELPSCGSVFKNPKSAGLHAWQVIEKLGLRGHRVGGACFSEKHSNFIVNDRSALAADVKALIDLAKSRAKNELGIELEEEVRYLGF